MYKIRPTALSLLTLCDYWAREAIAWLANNNQCLGILSDRLSNSLAKSKAHTSTSQASGWSPITSCTIDDRTQPERQYKHILRFHLTIRLRIKGDKWVVWFARINLTPTFMRIHLWESTGFVSRAYCFKRHSNSDTSDISAVVAQASVWIYVDKKDKHARTLIGSSCTEIHWLL